MAETKFEGGFDLRTVSKNGYFGQRFTTAHGITHNIETIQLRISKTNTAASTIGVGLWIGWGATAVLWEQKNFDFSGPTGRQWVSTTLTTPVPASEIAGKFFEVRLYHRDVSGFSTPNYTGEYNASATYPNSLHIHGVGSTHTAVGGQGSNFILSGAVPSAGPAVKRWTGTEWVPATIKRWNGSSWVTTSITRY